MRFHVLMLLCAVVRAEEPSSLQVLTEGFERTALGAVPAGFAKEGLVGVANDMAHTGRQSLRMEAAPKGGRRLVFANSRALAALGGEHWGRLYFRVRFPVPPPPVPAAGQKFSVVHFTIVSGKGRSPLFEDPVEVRMVDGCYGSNGGVQYLYNVQPAKRPEFGRGSRYDHRFADRWTLAEWHLDHATQTFQLFLDGQEVKEVSFTKGAGRFDKAEIPAEFMSLSFGWTNYQSAGEPGFMAWIDDVALAKTRLGPVSK